jgi:hypothetical protein
MPSFFQKYIIPISILLFLILLICMWLFPSSRFILTILFLLFAFVLASFPVIAKHRQSYLQGEISRKVFMRNMSFDVTGILLAVVLAALLGRYIAAMATEQISHDLIKLIAGIVIGLLIGLTVGIVVKHAWERLVKISPEN